MSVMDQQNESLAQYIHIQKNELLYRKHEKQKVEEINTCDCKYKNHDLESACGESCLNVLTCTECTPGYCPCDIYCKNQRFQKCEYAKLKLFKTEGRGWGLLADEDIKAGQFVTEYCGEVISWQEAKLRSQVYENQGIKEAYIISLSEKEFIDATRKGSLARFINHSCQPNCETRKWTVLGDIRVGIFSKQDILEGTELAYNYNFEWYGGAKVRCLCAATGCSEFLGAKSRGFQEATDVWDNNDARSRSSTAFHKKEVRKTRLTHEMRRALCNYKYENASSTQKDLQKWIEQQFNVSICQTTISNTLKRSVEYLTDAMKNSNDKGSSHRSCSSNNALTIERSDSYSSMAFHIKSVRKTTLTDEMRRALCEYKKENVDSSQKYLQKWVKQQFNVSISQPAISNTLKRSTEYLSDEMKNSNVKRHKPAKYPDLEKLLYEWFLQCEKYKNRVTGEMIRSKAKEFLLKKFGETNPEFQFSNGWLDRFKARYGIKAYGRFGESGSDIMVKSDLKLLKRANSPNFESNSMEKKCHVKESSGRDLNN